MKHNRYLHQLENLDTLALQSATAEGQEIWEHKYWMLKSETQEVK